MEECNSFNPKDSIDHQVQNQIQFPKIEITNSIGSQYLAYDKVEDNVFKVPEQNNQNNSQRESSKISGENTPLSFPKSDMRSSSNRMSSGLQQLKNQNLPDFLASKSVYGIYLNHLFTEDQKELLYIQIELEDFLTVKDAIGSILDVFDKHFENNKLPYRLNNILDVWQLYLSKKDGKPKLSYPALDSESKIVSVGSSNFTMSYRPEYTEIAIIDSKKLNQKKSKEIKQKNQANGKQKQKQNKKKNCNQNNQSPENQDNQEKQTKNDKVNEEDDDDDEEDEDGEQADCNMFNIFCWSNN